MAKPLISVISIIYDVEPYLRQCLKSLKALTYPELELILVVGQREEKDTEGRAVLKDDGCLEIAESYAAEDSRFKIVKCIAAGVGDARNRGLDAAKGELIGFVDGDDWVEPDMFDRLYSGLHKYNADISVCGKFSEYPGETIPDPGSEDIILMTPKEALKMLMKGDGFFFHCWDKLFKAELFEGIRFPTDKYLEDRYVIGGMLGDAEAIVYDRTPSYHFRVREDSVSHHKRMSELNSDADTAFAEYAVHKFPELKNRAEAFLLYGHITCIQNALAGGYFKREEEERHFAYVREHKESALKNRHVNRNTRLKVYLTLYALPLLKLITVAGQRGRRKEAFRKD